jgi:hypothetical protein
VAESSVSVGPSVTLAERKAKKLYYGTPNRRDILTTFCGKSTETSGVVRTQVEGEHFVVDTMDARTRIIRALS